MNVVQFGGMHRLTQCHTLPSGVRGCMMHTEFLLEFLIKNYSNIDLSRARDSGFAFVSGVHQFPEFVGSKARSIYERP